MNNQIHQVIVYNNPLEAALWSGQYGAYIFPVIAGVFVSVCVFLLLNRITETKWFKGIINKAAQKIRPNENTYRLERSIINNCVYVNVAIMIIILIAVIYKMII